VSHFEAPSGAIAANSLPVRVLADAPNRNTDVRGRVSGRRPLQRRGAQEPLV